MPRAGHSRPFVFFILGGIFVPPFFLCGTLFADSVVLVSGKDMKGLVVEEHEDRIILSTENGEVPVLRRDIQKIDYDDPSQNFFQIGRAYEEKKRWPEALSYYEKALEINPNLEEAKKASVRVRNLFWAKAATGPVDEIERRQELYERWGKKTNSGKHAGFQETNAATDLEQALGLKLVKKGDWVALAEVALRKDGWNAGLRRGDRLVAVDGSSLRYLSADAVSSRFTTPRLTAFTLEYDRECRIVKTSFEKEFREFGFELKLDARGLVITRVTNPSVASTAGLKAEDLLVEVNGESTRYLPVKKIMAVIQKNSSETQALLLVRRSALLTRR